MKLHVLLSILLLSGFAIFAQGGVAEEGEEIDEPVEIVEPDEVVVEEEQPTQAPVVEEEQPTQAPVPTSVISCFVGTTYDGEGSANETDCPAESDVCQTKIEVRDSGTIVYRQCKSALACTNNRKGNPSECFSQTAKDKRVLICYKCCKRDLCNDSEGTPGGVSLPPLPVDEVEEEVGAGPDAEADADTE